MRKKIKIRHTNGTDLTRLFSAKILGGSRGFDDNTLALETFSNDFTPTIKCLQGFTLIVEVEDEQNNRSEGSRPHLRHEREPDAAIQGRHQENKPEEHSKD